MWNRSWDLTRVVFFLNRYGIGICLVYVNYSEYYSSIRLHFGRLTTTIYSVERDEASY